MARERPSLGAPFGADGPWLNAILDVLGDLHDLLENRLPRPTEGGATGSGPVPVSEPAPDRRPDPVRPVTEPAPDGPPAVPGEDEPQPVEEQPSVEVPPRTGRGSSLEAWQRFADSVGVDYPASGSRNDVIAACVGARVIPAE